MNKLDEINRYYLYQHIRLDNNEVFYIGVGTKKFPKKLKKGRKKLDISDANIYHRAYDKVNRSNLWVKITKKVGRKVEILMESSNYDEIKNEEVRLIKLYGRINLKTGILANLTDGGEGELGRIGGITIFMYNIETGKFIKEFRNSYVAGQELNCYQGYIQEASKSEYIKSIKGYVFRRFKVDILNIPKNSFFIINRNGRSRIKTKSHILWQ